ncbi:2TM domain-containing protein [Pseudorhodoferax sp.]|uniref:2TM domain-containing protein n=1 Tax=Pseudorhodoferax sp. TaxID=1993553 RepID=UPI002DD6382B|nr:2TM domain-containing protein [Pseudorhodoferax sp.]
MSTTSFSGDSRLDGLARRRAKAKLGWFAHATVYVVVNAVLLALSLAGGRHWALFPLLGWGLGLLFHGLAVWMLAPGNALMDRMVERERERLQRTAPR